VAETIELDFYYEPVCGWAWRTSIWIRHVAREIPLQINWKLLALGVINSPDDYRKDPNVGHVHAAGLNRTLLLARRHGGNEAMDRLYIAYGNAIFGTHELLTWGDRLRDPTLVADPSDERYRAIQAGCLEAAGLPTTLYEEAQRDQSTEDEWLAEHYEAVERLGAFGTPTLALAGSKIGVFGPVIDPVPSGPDVIKLWDAVHLSLTSPWMYELKRNHAGRSDVQFAD
jgi:2-hydroxychromene-2-carboxylate isomerase